MENNDNIISVLNSLVETCKDGEKGYWEASEGIRNGFHRTLFKEYSRQRAEFAAELQAVVRKLGGMPDRRGTVAGSLHRGWMNLRFAMDSKNDDAIVSECERGETSALKNYRAALNTGLPTEIKTILEKQCAVIRATRQRVLVMAEHDGSQFC